MASIRQTLCDERFVDLGDAYGPLVIHGGWSTLTVIAGEHINKRIHFSSTWTWATSKEKDELAMAGPALRIWLRMCEVVDPDGEVFKERKGVPEALKGIQK
jgi:hypothetical protein